MCLFFSLHIEYAEFNTVKKTLTFCILKKKEEGDTMSKDTEKLLQQQNEEIQKLKKELKQATQPSSMFSVLKTTIKRSVHDFFVREDKMKNMDAKIKKLEKALEEKEDKLNQTTAELYAAVTLSQQCRESEPVEQEPDEQHPDETINIDKNDTHDQQEQAVPFPQTQEDAIKQYFGNINISDLAQRLNPPNADNPTERQTVKNDNTNTQIKPDEQDNGEQQTVEHCASVTNKNSQDNRNKQKNRQSKPQSKPQESLEPLKKEDEKLNQNANQEANKQNNEPIKQYTEKRNGKKYKIENRDGKKYKTESQDSSSQDTKTESSQATKLKNNITELNSRPDSKAHKTTTNNQKPDCHKPTNGESEEPNPTMTDDKKLDKKNRVSQTSKNTHSAPNTKNKSVSKQKEGSDKKNLETVDALKINNTNDNSINFANVSESNSGLGIVAEPYTPSDADTPDIADPWQNGLFDELSNNVFNDDWDDSDVS